MADDEMYLENLKEFVFDEERIVTYKWLSRTLSVNVNQAKQMLFAFIKQQQQDNAVSLCIIYTVGGLIKDNSGNLIQKYLFSHEENLNDIKTCFDKVTTLHVYSIQKTKPKDTNVLYLADYDLLKQNLDSPNRWSNITLKSIIKRSTNIPEDVHERKNDKVGKPISNGFQKPGQNQVQDEPKSVPSTSTSTTSKNSKTKPSMKKGDVASFFARQAASKNKGEKEDKKEMKSKIEVEKEQNKPGISASFNKLVKNEKKSVNEETRTGEQKKDVGRVVVDDKPKIKIVHQPDEEFETKKSSPREDEKKSRNKKKQNKGEKENQEDKETKSQKTKTKLKKENEEFQEKTKTQRKKRKRIKDFSDTSSEEEDNSVSTKQSSSGTDNTSIPDGQAQVIKPETQKNRRRKKVLKSKTYLNDDGYMVTEKIYEIESASSEEEEKKPSIKVGPNKPPELKDSIQPPKKKPANKATKQASLTSFFKRT